jgi:hypothetical protein
MERAGIRLRLLEVVLDVIAKRPATDRSVFAVRELLVVAR